MFEWTVLDYLPEWLFFLFSLSISLGSVELGYRVGLLRHLSLVGEEEKDSPTGGIVAATLGLLAFLLGFTFSMAAERFEVRRELFEQEVNAIRTTQLRTHFLPAESAARARKWLREYVDARVEALNSSSDLDALLRQSAELQKLLWSDAIAAGKESPESGPVAMYVDSLNRMFDLQSQRLTAGVRARIPKRIWGGLFLAAVVAMCSMGYQAGLANSARPFAAIGMALCFVIAMQLTLELDRPGDHLLSIDPAAMIELQRSMRAEMGG